MRQRIRWSGFAVTMVVVVVLGLRGLAGPSPAALLFQEGLMLERAEGNLRAAAARYERVVKEYPTERVIVAQALLQLGALAEPPAGDGSGRDSRRQYERIVREFADVTPVVTVARARLAAMQGDATRSADSIVLRPVLTGAGADRYGSVSRDGRYLSMMDLETNDLAIRDLGTGQMQRVTHMAAGSREVAEYSVFSPDASRLAYGWLNGDNKYELRIINRDGSGSRLLFRNGTWLQPYDWSPDGRTILALIIPDTNVRQLALISADEGTVRVLKTLDWLMGVPSKASFSPDGRYIAYDRRSLEDSENTDVFVIAADGTGEAPAVNDAARDLLLGWFPDGQGILVSSDRHGQAGAWSVPVKNGRPNGSQRLLKPDIGALNAKGFVASGAFYYFQNLGMVDVSVVGLDPVTSRVTQPPAALKPRESKGRFNGLWAADGDRVLCAIGGANSKIAGIYDTKTGALRTVPIAMNYVSPLNWTPDGAALIATGTDAKLRNGVFRIDPTTGSPTLIASGSATGIPDMSSDGRLLYFRRFIESPAGPAVPVLIERNLDSGAEREVFRDISDFRLSPDRRALLVRTFNRPERVGLLLVVPTSGGSPREILRDRIADYAWRPALAWMPDGKSVLMGRSAGELWRVSVDGTAPTRLGLSLPGLQFVSVSPDGRRLALTAGELTPQVWTMENLSLAAPSTR